MLSTNLKAYWKLDETSGNPADASGAGNTLTNVGTATFSAGKINNGVNLVAASTQYLSILNSAQVGLGFTSDFSVSAWLKLTSLPVSNSYAIVTKDDQASSRSYMFYYNPNSTLTLYISAAGNTWDGSNTSSAAAISSLGVWFYVVVTYTASSKAVIFYCNGAQLGTTQTNIYGSVYNGSAPVQVGHLSAGTPSLFNGSMDEVGMWSRALTLAEVQSLYNGGAGLAYPFTLPTGNTGAALLAELARA